MIRRVVLAGALAALALNCVPCAAMPTASVTIRVLEEDGQPSSGAKVVVSFWIDKPTGGVGNVNMEGVADSEGRFEAKADTSGYVSWGALKPGYYRSVDHFDFKRHELGRWQPWGTEATLVVRKIGKPVPMYARYTRGMPDLPALGKPIGYDLLAADWTPPHGAGKYADLVFEASREFRAHADYDCSVRVRFSNPFDGIQLVKEDRRRGSDFHLPRMAPESGYQDELVLKGSSRPRVAQDRGCSDDDNYILRTRSVVEDGKLVRAMYGKVPGGICVSPERSETVQIRMTYFLNPDYTRNLEFDPEKNLFPPGVPGSRDGQARCP